MDAARTVYDYFARAVHRRTAAREPLRIAFDAEGACAGFTLDVRGNRIEGADYRCTTCATLVALCEHACELAVGSAPRQLTRLDANALLALHPEIPPSRAARAGLVAAALRLALDDFLTGGRG